MKSKSEVLDNNTSSEEKAATLIQKKVRGFLNYKKYGIKHLGSNFLTKHPTFVVGNDPGFPKSISKFHESDEKIAVIATSGLRAVSIACKLGNQKHTPKIILIDNSALVYKFWYALRELMQDENKTCDQNQFMKYLPEFLEQNKHLYLKVMDQELIKFNSYGVQYLNQDITVHFNTLFVLFGYDYVKSVIQHATLIKQSWGDVDIFIKLKNILNVQGIKKTYMYPSNIVATINNETLQERILKNIETFDPILSIHTNYCQIHGQPEKICLFKTQKPEKAKSILFAYKYAEQCYKEKMKETKRDKQHVPHLDKSLNFQN